MMNNMDPGLTVILGIRLGIGENRHFLAFEILKKNRNNSEIFHEIFHRQKNRHFYNSRQSSRCRRITCTVDLSVVGVEMRTDEQNEVCCVEQKQDRSEDRPLGNSAQN